MLTTIPSRSTRRLTVHRRDLCREIVDCGSQTMLSASSTVSISRYITVAITITGPTMRAFIFRIPVPSPAPQQVQPPTNCAQTERNSKAGA